MEGKDRSFEPTPVPTVETSDEKTLTGEELRKIFGDTEAVEVSAKRYFDTLQVQYGDRRFFITAETPDKPGLTEGFLKATGDGMLTPEEYEKYSPYTFMRTLDMRGEVIDDNGVMPEVALVVAALIAGSAGVYSRRKFLNIAGVATALIGFGAMISHNSRPKDGYGNGLVGTVREELSYVIEDRYRDIEDLKALFTAHKLCWLLTESPQDEIVFSTKHGTASLEMAETYLNEHGEDAHREILKKIEEILSRIDMEKNWIDTIEPSFDVQFLSPKANRDEQVLEFTDWDLRGVFKKYGLIIRSVDPGLDNSNCGEMNL